MKPFAFRGCLVALAITNRAVANDNYRRDDAFDIAQGTIITDSTPAYPGSDVQNMFGGDYGSLEQGTGGLIFQDFDFTNADAEQAHPAGSGYVYWVNFQTPYLVRLSGYHLVTAGDLGRHSGSFALKADLDGDGEYETLIDSYTPAPQAVVPPNAVGDITRQWATPVVAKRFRAEFTIALNPLFMEAPRVYELDSITEPDPDEPQTVLSSPGEGDVFKVQETIHFEATATDNDPIDHVEFLVNGESIGIGEQQGSKWVREYSFYTPGNYEISARAVDVFGSSGTAVGIPISVVTPNTTQRNWLYSADGKFQFDVAGVVEGNTYFIYDSIDLIHWNPVATNTIPYGNGEIWTYTSDPPPAPRRFFKVIGQ